MVKQANNIIKKFDESLAIGPSHFMTQDLDSKWLELTWKYSIIPEIEESIEMEEDLKDLVNLPRIYNPQHNNMVEE